MDTHLAFARFWIVLVLLFGVLVIWTWPLLVHSSPASPYLRMTFLDVGQGDAILLQTPDGVEMLIDGGSDKRVLQMMRQKQGWFDTSLDIVLATHFDGDHIGGLDDVLQRYDVGTVVVSGNTTGSDDAKRLETAIEEEKIVPYIARAGDVMMLGASTTVTVFSPTYDVSDIESNNASIVTHVSYGDTAFLLTGDAPKEIELYLIAKYGDALAADVLKLGHHGSRTSSDSLFLEVVDPAYAIVSAAKENDYGHPHEEVVVAVDDAGIELLETAQEGSITFLSDGERVWRQ